MPFSAYRDNFDAETLAILEAAFNEAWEVVRASGRDFDHETTRNALADLIMHEYPAHDFDKVFSGPAARWFAMIPAIEERHGVETGRSYLARAVSRTMMEAEAYILERYRVI